MTHRKGSIYQITSMDLIYNIYLRWQEQVFHLKVLQNVWRRCGFLLCFHSLSHSLSIRCQWNLWFRAKWHLDWRGVGAKAQWYYSIKEEFQVFVLGIIKPHQGGLMCRINRRKKKKKNRLEFIATFKALRKTHRLWRQNKHERRM